MLLLSIQKLREETNFGQTYLHNRIKDNKNEQINQIIPTINMRYIPYYSDEVNDGGWGCAWRSIQMLLSSQYNITPEFKWLFSFFGQKEILEKIYKNLYQVDIIPDYLQNAQYAPHELQNGWAEPYIGQLILHYMGFQTKLFLINSYPIHANAPKEVFQETFNFKQFKEFMIEHFQNRKSPIQIDDATYSMVIHDCKILNNNNIIIYVGDPHIYYIQQNNKQIGLYTVELNEQGDQISYSIQAEDEQFYMYKNSFKTLHFNGKSWMAVCIMGSIDVWLDWRQRQLII